ncbi:hypothetical protein DACRYDRAFT_104994 [Dacryopinax primogenitus]|uniref:Uncharacterized protein n=1 Tax=Dacryopinax primogenitus (strain DJM 731) TaxID=1858805 RepID=M5G9W8_DACPD|nr:uncharacterized protein DACRYDRAFT_104994 [Dacryopinax primogenitus]EJU05110.1 hypothetical protein DACRYDRAFT_104994 [Dacryopinax primogenitus]
MCISEDAIEEEELVTFDVDVLAKQQDAEHTAHLLQLTAPCQNNLVQPMQSMMMPSAPPRQNAAAPQAAVPTPAPTTGTTHYNRTAIEQMLDIEAIVNGNPRHLWNVLYSQHVILLDYCTALHQQENAHTSLSHNIANMQERITRLTSECNNALNRIASLKGTLAAYGLHQPGSAGPTDNNDDDADEELYN